MKKIIIVLCLIVSILCINKQPNTSGDTIRFRIIANSNSKSDQQQKKEIVKSISDTLINSNVKTVEEERKYIKAQIPTFEKQINKSTKDYSINYGQNYFPKKEHNGIIYEAGEYESLVITLGQGEGDNFWCILFPPLCMIDENEVIEYKSIIKEVLKKIF